LRIMEARELFQKGYDTLHLSLSEGATDNFIVYLSELQKWNRKINLIGKASLKNIIEKHFFDSLFLLSHLEKSHELKLLDVGSGAGFPGLVLKAACPSLQLTLAEPRQKRVSFLRHVVRTLKLDHVEVIDTRIEPGEKQQENTFPLITSRALSNIAEFLELIRHSSSPGGLILCMKGPKAEDEINQWQKASPRSPFTLVDSTKYHLPFSGDIRNIVTFKKD
jgi:16S rRNA (guanine527-N7)-methyltransferase